MKIILIAAAFAIAIAAPAKAHDHWANGMAVPAWVKASCCGPEDVHQIDLEDVHELPDGSWRVEGAPKLFPRGNVFDSQDGYVWAFYNQYNVFCLFIPRTS